jgi:hypothetical protein
MINTLNIQQSGNREKRYEPVVFRYTKKDILQT